MSSTVTLSSAENRRSLSPSSAFVKILVGSQYLRLQSAHGCSDSAPLCASSMHEIPDSMQVGLY